MQTKDDLILSVVNAHVMAGQKTNAEKHTGYGDRFLKASKIVLTDGVKTTGRGEYEVHSGTDAHIMYHVNGTCECQDWKNWVHHERWLKDRQGKDVSSFAPKGFCKHRIAVVIDGKVKAKLKWTVEQSIVHPHRWACEAHRQVPVECWQHACPDPESIPCPTCTTGAHADPVTGEVEAGSPMENPNVPAYVEEIITEEEVPVVEYVITPEEHAQGLGAEHTEPPVSDALPPLVTAQYEEAPVVEPPQTSLPEAPASLNIKLRMDNIEVMYTMRSRTDGEVLERLPNVLATLERLMKTEVDHDESFLKRLLHAFFPRPSKYAGK